ncbi:MAG: SurA N-terminal domain-containing protein [Bacteroidales bacterium]|nr:SurA N-terminal domain-containing protein [Bacteroidales bacterium]
MAIIGKIRSYGSLLVIIIGVALAGFVLQDFWRKGDGGRNSPKDFAKVNGEKISYLDFDKKVEEQLEQMKKQEQGKNLGSDKIYQTRQQVWSQMIREIIMDEQYEELGLTVTADELFDMIQGKEPHQYIVQSFSDPKTGMFDRERLSQFLKNYDQLTPEIKTQWVNLEKAIKSERLNKKYNNLITNVYYVPKAFAQRNYIEKNKKFVARFFDIQYNTVKDTNVTVTKDEINKCFEENKQQYEQNETVASIDYVIFDVLPSESDKKMAEEDIFKAKKELEQVSEKEIVNCVNINSDEPYDSTFLAQGKLMPVKLDSAMFAATPGTIVGPYLDNSTFIIARLINKQMRPDSMKARHILISYQGAQSADENLKRTKAQAKKLADSLFNVLKNSKDINTQFPFLSNQYSGDGTAKEKGGDLGWFADGAMVYPFNQACFEAKAGEVKMVETIFGFHVLQLTDKKAPVNKVRVAVVKRKIEPSTKTRQDVYAKASKFAGENKTLELFEKSVKTQGLNKRNADYLKEMDYSIPGIEQARSMVMWIYDEKTKIGDVKDFDFETDNKYVVAALKKIKKKGIPVLEDIEKEITALAKRDKKAETFTKQIIDAKKNASTFELLAAKLNCKVDTAKDLSFSSYSMPGTGPEPKVIGKICTMNKALMSEPLKGNRGVFVVIVDQINEAPKKDDFKNEIQQQVNIFRSRAGWEVYNALEKVANIKDNRRYFY